MEKYLCNADIGSVLIGNENWTVSIPNEGGDGTVHVMTFDSEREYVNSVWGKNLKFVTSVHGTFGVYDYDSAFSELHSLKMSINDATVILKGIYGVYRGYFTVALVKWFDSFDFDIYKTIECVGGKVEIERQKSESIKVQERGE